MIASGRKRIRKSVKDAVAVMNDHGCFTVHQQRRADDSSTKHLSDALMSQTNTQNRNFSMKILDHVIGNSGVIRSSGTGRNYKMTRPKFFRFFKTTLIVVPDGDGGAQDSKCLIEVVRKRIIIIDQQNVFHSGS